MDKARSFHLFLNLGYSGWLPFDRSLGSGSGTDEDGSCEVLYLHTVIGSLTAVGWCYWSTDITPNPVIRYRGALTNRLAILRAPGGSPPEWGLGFDTVLAGIFRQDLPSGRYMPRQPDAMFRLRFRFDHFFSVMAKMGRLRVDADLPYLFSQA